MKKLLLTILFIAFYINIFAQIGINTDGSSPDSKAILDVSSTTKGVLFPRMTSEQRNALATTLGLTVFDTNTNSYWFYNGIAWVNMAYSGSVNDWASSENYTYTTKPYTNVGIGTTTPQSDLTIEGAGGDMLRVKSTAAYLQVILDSKTGDDYLSFRQDGAQKYKIGTQSTGDFLLYQEGKGRIFTVNAETGNVGFNHNEPTEVVDVKGRIRIRKDGGVTAGIWYGNSTNSVLAADGAFLGLQNDQTLGIYIGNSWKMGFTNLGNMTIAGTLSENSDKRLKKNFVKLSNPMKAIESLNGYHYNWIAADRDSKLQTGLIAQEVEKIMPELVSENEEGIKSVNYSGLIPYLIESIKILNREIIQLKKQRL